MKITLITLVGLLGAHAVKSHLLGDVSDRGWLTWTTAIILDHWRALVGVAALPVLLAKSAKETVILTISVPEASNASCVALVQLHLSQVVSERGWLTWTTARGINLLVEYA